MRMSARTLGKSLLFALATLVVTPALISYYVRQAFIGRDRALEGSSQALALVPGIPGQYMRRAFLARVLSYCDRSVTVEFGTIFSRAGARLDANAYVGAYCHLGLVHIERDALIAAAVHIPSGPATHGVDDLSKPIREQPGKQAVVRIGAGAWIGSASVVLADVGRDTIVGAGSVVSRPLPERVMAAGTPARVIRHRDTLGQSA
jgi:acetyltransferase-like isoleucine patch superfamily enzyme